MHTTLTQLSDALAAAVERAAACTVAVHARSRISSSGVVWSPGVVVTADHAVQFDEARVRLPDGTEAKAVLAGRDRATDIAVLRVETSAAPPAFAEAAELKAGNLALAVGRTDQGVIATMGILSTVAGPWRTWRGGVMERFLRLDVALYASSSGAAVADARGAVLGLATSGLSRTSAIAIPKATVDKVVAELLRSGHVARAYLGVGLQPVALPEHLKNKLDLKQDGGVIVLSVEPGGPAGQAGLFIGDVMLELNGRAVADTDEIQSALADETVGSVARVVVLRGGELAALDVTVGQRPRRE